jgi:hypothetical protein
VKQALRALQRLTVEGDHLRHYEAELAGGAPRRRCRGPRSPEA